jgi:hypothetical protein
MSWILHKWGRVILYCPILVSRLQGSFTKLISERHQCAGQVINSGKEKQTFRNTSTLTVRCKKVIISFGTCLTLE